MDGEEKNIQGLGSPGGLTPAGTPNLEQYGIPTANSFIPKPQGEHHKDVKMLYQEFIGQGMSPKDAAKQAQSITGMSIVTGRPIMHQNKFSKKTGHVIGQYGTSSGKATSGKLGSYGR